MKKLFKHIINFLPIYMPVLVILIMALNYIIFIGKENMGEYGDIFGLSNAFFTGIALSFLIYGIFMQREEIKIAKEDLKRTKDILEDQSRYINEQKFNTQFFSMIELLSNYIINYKYTFNREFHGNMALQVKKNNIFRTIKGTSRINITNMAEQDILMAIDNLEVCRVSINNELKDVHQIIKLSTEIAMFLDRSYIDSKKYYINVLRSVINDDLSNILCVYIHVNKKTNLKDLLIKEYKIAYWP